MARVKQDWSSNMPRSTGGQPRERRDYAPEPESEFTEEVIHINRVAKVVKGGRKFHFTALVALGDKKDRVGLGYGKAAEVVDAIKKGVDDAKRNMIVICKQGTTIPYEVKSHYCASTIVLRPAAKGHGIIAGGSARPILALSGLEDVTAKFVGSNNPINCARSTFQALKLIQRPDFIKRLRNGEKLDSQGRYIADKAKVAAEEAIEAFTAEERAETGEAAIIAIPPVKPSVPVEKWDTVEEEDEV